MRLQRWARERVVRGKLLLRCRLLGDARRFGAHGGGDGEAYRGGRPLQLVESTLGEWRQLASICACVRAGSENLEHMM